MGTTGTTGKRDDDSEVLSAPPLPGPPVMTPAMVARLGSGTQPPDNVPTTTATPRRASTFELLRSLGDSLVVIALAVAVVSAALIFGEASRNELFKLFAAFYFSLLPAFLYLQFMAVRGPTLWEEFTENLYRLRVDDPASLPRPSSHCRYYRIWARSVDRSSEPTKTLYQKKFEGVFGLLSFDDKATPTLHREKLGPVLMGTLLFAVAWILVVMPASIFNLLLFHEPTAPQFSTTLPLETLRFGFLGAYFYAVQMLVRRYFQNDLKTSAYLNATMRIVIVVLLTWTIDLGLAAADDTPLSVAHSQAVRSSLAFVIGVFPDVGWKALQELVKLPLRPLVPSLRQPYPLSDLDGLNVWYEARLLEEGLEDMQNLATCNLVDVMLNTRIPVERLVDWIDQSILCLHLGTQKSKAKTGDARDRLRRFGIRTATDLEDALRPMDESPAEAARVAKLEQLLNTGDGEPSVLRTILATFHSEPNLHYVRAWRASEAAGQTFVAS